jgi:hypothetical protein
MDRVEKVHTIEDFHDSPRKGIADLNGVAHWFECEWDKAADDYAATYLLSPVDDLTLSLATERDEIFGRWVEAFRAGTVALDTFPALRDEKARYDELTKRLDGKLSLNPERQARAVGTFVEDGVVWEIR